MLRKWGVSLLGVAAAMALSQVASAQNTFLILDENVDAVIKAASKGEGTPSKSNDAFSGKESLFVGSTGGDGQKYNEAMPDWNFNIVENPKAATEFRYITFAWKKDGGEGLQLQLHGNPDTWGHRYHAGKNVKNWTPSLESGALPTAWRSETKDLFKDWKAFTLTGIAFSAWDGKGGLWDQIILHKTPDKPTAVEAKSKAAMTWADLKASK